VNDKNSVQQLNLKGGGNVSANIEKEDLRKTKTRKAIYTALYSLLGRRDLNKITVTDICEEALIGRATFYSYFIDKYDLLKYWLTNLWSENLNILSTYSTYDQIEKASNHFIHENKSLLKNLIYDMDHETLDVLFDFILSSLNLAIVSNDSKKVHPKNVVLSNYCAGGTIFYFLWQVKNGFPEDIQPMNIHLYELINKFQEWDSEEK